MSSLNKVMLIGNLGKDPENLKKGSFVRISLATTHKYRNENGDVSDSTQWHTVFFNGKLAKIALDYLKKGSKIYISGELRYSEWKDKEGQRRFSTAVHASELKFLDVKHAEKAEELTLSEQEDDSADLVHGYEPDIGEPISA